MCIGGYFITEALWEYKWDINSTSQVVHVMSLKVTVRTFRNIPHGHFLTGADDEVLSLSHTTHSYLKAGCGTKNSKKIAVSLQTQVLEKYRNVDYSMHPYICIYLTYLLQYN